MKTYWISKCALSEGIKAVDGDPSEWDSRYINVTGYYSWFRLGTQIHETELAARKAADAMRLKKIASLKKQLAELEKLSFN